MRGYVIDMVFTVLLVAGAASIGIGAGYLVVGPGLQ